MLVLFETPSGYAIFKVLDKKKLKKTDDIYKSFLTAEDAQNMVKLKAFSKFNDTTEALAAATAICDGTLDSALEDFLRVNLVDKKMKGKLAVVDTKLGGLIKEKLGIKVMWDDTVAELMRGIRAHADSLISGGALTAADSNAMKLGLSHTLGRYKLKFSPDKVDTMIIQAIALLDELDKELNTYAMRVREWYGWHFPEMSRIVTDNILYAKTVRKMGTRNFAKSTDLSDILPEEMEGELKDAAEVSMGTPCADEDIENIQALCDQVINISEYRASLYEYLRHRMNAIAPNLTFMVGELVGARLIAHAGSLMNLAKHPASTVQILGAEKALFRALKTKHDTPKYGLIYHASLVGQATPKNKGKISRVLAAKTALSIRVDALGETEGHEAALAHRESVERRLQALEGGSFQAISKTNRAHAIEEKFTPNNTSGSYNTSADVTPMNESSDGEQAKKKKKKKRKAEALGLDESEEPKKKKKKKKKTKKESSSDDDESEKKKKRKKKTKKSKK